MTDVREDLFDTLAGTDWHGRFESFDAAETRRLRLYDALASELGQEKFFSKPQRLSVKASAEDSYQRFEHAGKEALRSMTMVFRQLWQDGEPARYETIRSLLRTHAKPTPRGTEAVALLDLLGSRFKRERRHVLMSHVWEDDPVGEPIRVFRAARVLDDWFNGVLFHPDEHKARSVRAWSPTAYEYSAVKSINRIAGVMWELHLVVMGVLDTDAVVPSESSAAAS
jgi:hypothetical protein